MGEWASPTPPGEQVILSKYGISATEGKDVSGKTSGSTRQNLKPGIYLNDMSFHHMAH